MIRQGKLRIKIKDRVNIIVAKYLKGYFDFISASREMCGIIDSDIAFSEITHYLCNSKIR